MSDCFASCCGDDSAPTDEEKDQWSRGLEVLLSSSRGRSHFRSFLHAHHVFEDAIYHLDFIEGCQKLSELATLNTSSAKDEIRHLENRLYDDLVDGDLVNLDEYHCGQLRKQVKQHIRERNIDWFQIARNVLVVFLTESYNVFVADYLRLTNKTPPPQAPTAS